MLEPIAACNLDCAYCYADCASNDVLDLDTLRIALDKVKDHAQENGFKGIDIVWQGGEPLLAGIDYFRSTQDLITRWDTARLSRQFLQTNGLLLTEDLARLFMQHDVHVGLSLDGPRDFHDRIRTDPAGHGTFDKVMDHLTMTERMGLRVGINAVLTPHAIGHADRLYEFFRQLGYGFRVNPLMPGRHVDPGRLRMFRPGEYGGLLCDLFDAWIGCPGGRVKVSPLDSFLTALTSGITRECQQGRTCRSSHLAVRADGGALLCSRFPNAFLGWIAEDSVEQLLASPLCLMIDQRESELTTCQACEYLEICHGGCPLNNFAMQRPIAARDPFCADYRRVFEHIRSRLTEDLDD